MLTEGDLKICLNAFELSGDLEKLDAFEQICLNNLQQMSAETVSAILYTYAMERRGSSDFIESLTARIESEQFSSEKLPGPLIVQIVVTLNLLGKSNTAASARFSEMA